MNDGYSAFSNGMPYWAGDSKKYFDNFEMQYFNGITGRDEIYNYKDDNIKEQIIGIESDEERPLYSTKLVGGKKTFRKKSKKRKTKRNRKTRR